MKKETIDPRIKEVVSSLAPSCDINTGLAQLIIKEIDRELAVYESTAKEFEKKYGMKFDEFYKSDLMKKPSHEVEQDYFDWEMAVTIINKLRPQLVKIRQLLEK